MPVPTYRQNNYKCNKVKRRKEIKVPAAVYPSPPFPATSVPHGAPCVSWLQPWAGVGPRRPERGGGVSGIPPWTGKEDTGHQPWALWSGVAVDLVPHTWAEPSSPLEALPLVLVTFKGS